MQLLGEQIGRVCCADRQPAAANWIAREEQIMSSCDWSLGGIELSIWSSEIDEEARSSRGRSTRIGLNRYTCHGILFLLFPPTFYSEPLFGALQELLSHLAQVDGCGAEKKNEKALNVANFRGVWPSTMPDSFRVLRLWASPSKVLHHLLMGNQRVVVVRDWEKETDRSHMDSHFLCLPFHIGNCAFVEEAMSRINLLFGGGASSSGFRQNLKRFCVDVRSGQSTSKAYVRKHPFGVSDDWLVVYVVEDV